MATPQWNSVMLFFNLPADIRPDNYLHTTAQDALNLIDLGVDAAQTKISDFLCNYWNTLSYGNLSFGVATPRNASGNPIVPTLRPEDNNPLVYGDLIRKYLTLFAEEVWVAAGRKMKDGVRWIPSIVLIQRYKDWPTAGFTGFEQDFSGLTYLIGNMTHISYSLTKTSASNFPDLNEHGRKFWGVLCHEFGHNFVEFVDLYEPQGAMGYWDLLGTTPLPGRMSEVSSYLKERIGWLEFNEVIMGPSFPQTNFSIRPYTSTGDAIKIVPDPDHNPKEFFLIEYRKSIGNEIWRPDGALTEEGLLITHVNTRLGVSKLFLMREAPFLDPEFADFSDKGVALRTDYTNINGVLFPNGSNNSFTRTSLPSSNFYGNRASGLSIENIRISRGRCRFTIKISVQSTVGWHVSTRDRAVSGRFHGNDRPNTIFMRNDQRATMLRMMQSQWFSVQSASGWIGDWQLTANDKIPLVGDFDGDGRDELYFRDANRAGVIGFNGSWYSKTVQSNWINGWNLGRDNWELVANVDGDSKDEIIVRSPKWIGLFKLEGNGRSRHLALKYIKKDNISAWQLNAGDRMVKGHFRNSDKHEVLLIGHHRGFYRIGLISWSSSTNSFDLIKRQRITWHSWNIGRSEEFVVGDFDGDGLDEIYLRSERRAGLLKWRNNRFEVLWGTENELEHISGEDDDKFAIYSGDSSNKGKFMPDRDCILHRNREGIAILSWDGTKIKVRQTLTSRFDGRWQLGARDNFVLGDYHNDGPDITKPNEDYIGDDIDDIFIHNSWGTSTVGVNFTEWDPVRNTGRIREEMGITWIQERSILTYLTGG